MAVVIRGVAIQDDTQVPLAGNEVGDFAGLQEVDERPDRSGRPGGGGSAISRRPRELSSQLTVGLAGEWLAYQWLAQQYGPDFTQDCWVSKYNREQLFPADGDDGLGWDFEVTVRRGKHYYEVKITLGDDGRIELGETQVIAAQENARNGQWRLLMITNALPENRRIHMLRNPFDPASRGRYSFVGQGLRLCYSNTRPSNPRY